MAFMGGGRFDFVWLVPMWTLGTWGASNETNKLQITHTPLYFTALLRVYVGAAIWQPWCGGAMHLHTNDCMLVTREHTLYMYGKRGGRALTVCKLTSISTAEGCLLGLQALLRRLGTRRARRLGRRRLPGRACHLCAREATVAAAAAVAVVGPAPFAAPAVRDGSLAVLARLFGG